jgi:hypothetical protein
MMFFRKAKAKEAIIADDAESPRSTVVESETLDLTSGVVPDQQQKLQRHSKSLREQIDSVLCLDEWWHDDAKVFASIGLLILALPVATYIYGLFVIEFPYQWRFQPPLTIPGAFWLFYFQPYLIGISRGVRNPMKLLSINLLSGWTIVGWFLCLKSAFSEKLEANASANANSIRSGILVAIVLAVTCLALNFAGQTILSISLGWWAESILVAHFACTNFCIHSRNHDARGQQVPTGWNGLVGALVPALFVDIRAPFLFPGLLVSLVFFQTLVTTTVEQINVCSTILYVGATLLVTYRLSAAIDQSRPRDQYRRVLKWISPTLLIMACVILVAFRVIPHPFYFFVGSFIFAYWRLAALLKPAAGQGAGK